MEGSFASPDPDRSRGRPRAPAGTGLLALALLAVAPAPAAAQAAIVVEVRAGAVYSTPFARGTAVVPAELEAVARDLEVGPRLAPFAELALAVRSSPALVLEMRTGAGAARVVGKGGGDAWAAGRMAAVHILGGVRLPLPQLRALDIRAGAGKVLYLSDDVNLLEENEYTGVLLSAGFGYRLPGPLPWIGVAEVHWHEFDPDPLAGAGAGAVTRLLVHLAVPVRGNP